MKKEVVHKFFGISLLLKGLNAVLEIIGGALLPIFSLEKINGFVFFLTQNELSEDPKDFIAGYLMDFAKNLSISAQLFGSFYLISHGLIKIFLIIGLWKRKLWVYPLAVAVFVLFIAYQVFRYAYSHSLGLVALTVLDIFIVALIWLEYRQLKPAGLKNI